MGYNISIHTKETKQNFDEYPKDDFFEQQQLIEPFTDEQYLKLKNRLLKYSYTIIYESKNEITFTHSNVDFGLVLLTKSGLYFRTNLSEESIVEVALTASEFTDTGEFYKYDPQTNEWENPDRF